MLSFGQRLRILRKEADLSQNDLAEQLFVSVQSVSKWECDNAMPDIGQIVPLAAILGVTTDCLLGVGTDEKADREKCFEACENIWKKHNGNSYENNAWFMCYEIFRDFIKKYPLAYDVKLACAGRIWNFFYSSIDGTRYQIPKDEEKALYDEAVKLLTTVINRSNDPGYLMDARETLILLYLYKREYEKAISVGSMSKIFSLAGLRMGWIATRDEYALNECMERRDYNTISCGVIDDKLASIALANKDKIFTRNSQILNNNRTILDQ